MITALVNGKIFTGEQFTGKEWLTQCVVIIEHEKIIALCHENNLPNNIDQQC